LKEMVRPAIVRNSRGLSDNGDCGGVGDSGGDGVADREDVCDGGEAVDSKIEYRFGGAFPDVLGAIWPRGRGGLSNERFGRV
jgi:hypothetical protein